MSDVTLESPYLPDGGLWLKGNLHTHTTRSDGRADPQEMIARYAGLGHDFLMLSDHDTHGEADGLDPQGMVILPGNEISAGGPHLLDVGARTRITPDPDRQGVIDAVRSDSGFPVLSHPNWTENFNHYTYELMLRLTGYVGIEIFNGVVIDLAGSHLALDKWDRLLTEGRVIWGFANDDAHGPEQADRGWNVVLAVDRTPGAILEAMRTGSFYASSGVTIERIACEGPELIVSAPDADEIWVFGHYGKRLLASPGPDLRFDVSEVAGPYIRFECYGRGGACAWSQPFRVRGGKYETLRRRVEELRLRERPTLHVLRVDRAPRLTGRLDDPLWQQAEGSSNFVRLSDGEVPTVKTELRALADGETLFLGVFCEEPNPETIKTKTSPENPANVWMDDSVEFFLDVKGDASDYVQVQVNAAGHVLAVDAKTNELLGGCVRTAADRVAGGWCIEAAVSVAALGGSTAPGECWGFHVCRNRKPVSENFVWSWVGTSNHTPERFGSLLF